MGEVPVYSEDMIRSLHLPGCEFEYVMFTDYQKLEKRIKQLESENQRLRDVLIRIKSGILGIESVKYLAKETLDELYLDIYKRKKSIDKS